MEMKTINGEIHLILGKDEIVIKGDSDDALNYLVMHNGKEIQDCVAIVRMGAKNG